MPPVAETRASTSTGSPAALALGMLSSQAAFYFSGNTAVFDDFLSDACHSFHT